MTLESVILSEFSIPIDLNSFITYFWSDPVWYKNFLIEQLEDLNVVVGEWEENSQLGNEIINRTINSDHPSKVSFPGLPSHSQSIKLQTIQVFSLSYFNNRNTKYFISKLCFYYIKHFSYLTMIRK